MKNKTERSYVDILKELDSLVASDAIPDKDAREIEDAIFRLKELLWKYSA